jgi:acyl carrier protein
MNVQEIEQQLIKGIATITNKDAANIAPDRPFHELGIDSLGLVEILVYIEKNFKLQLIAADITKKDFESIRALAAHISKKL